MADYTITGNDTLVLWNRVFQNYADGEITKIDFTDDIIKLKTGKDQNTIYSRNEGGNNVTLTLRLLRGTADDRFMRAELAKTTGKKLPNYVLATGQFVKTLGDGLGNVVNDVYNLEGGIITKNVAAMENVDGDTNQGVAVYEMKFALGKTSIG